jgi:hypothetical protein
MLHLNLKTKLDMDFIYICIYIYAYGKNPRIYNDKIQKNIQIFYHTVFSYPSQELSLS